MADMTNAPPPPVPARWVLPRLVSKLPPADAVLVLIVASSFVGMHLREIYVGDYWPTQALHIVILLIEARLLRLLLDHVCRHLPRRTPQQDPPAQPPTEGDAA